MEARQRPAYLIRKIDWTMRLGRVAYCRKMTNVGLIFIVRGDLETLWYPIGLGFFWRQRNTHKVIVTTDML